MFTIVLLSFPEMFSYKGVCISRHAHLMHSHSDKLIFVFSAGLVVYLNPVCV